MKQHTYTHTKIQRKNVILHKNLQLITITPDVFALLLVTNFSMRKTNKALTHEQDSGVGCECCSSFYITVSNIGWRPQV